MWIKRNLESIIKTLSNTRPAILLTGVRQSGKSSLLRRIFPKAHYVTLDNINMAQYAEDNPSMFLKELNQYSKVIIDEIQYAPLLFRELKIIIDNNRNVFGKWILTGSQQFSLMKEVSESLAGRISILHLQTLSLDELRGTKKIFDLKNVLFKGGYPETWAYPEISIQKFFDDYIQTYLERDLRNIININNLRDFQRFMKSCAIRVSNLINFSDIAKDIGVSANTIKSWINCLETSGVIVLLSPYYANIGKRLIKAPKLYFSDQGLLCHLLNINNAENLYNHIHEGAIWENFVFTELVKNINITPSQNLFFYRDQNNVEIDFVIEHNNIITLIEAKSSQRVNLKKLNFSKVQNRLKNKTSCLIACPIDETKLIHLKNYKLVNPINNSIEF